MKPDIRSPSRVLCRLPDVGSLERTTFGKGFPWLAALIGLLSLVGLANAVDSPPPLRAVVTTNIVIVTNYVVVTNFVAGTNAMAESSPVVLTNWVPPADDFDWIQLVSGEWLKGRLKGMEDEKLSFDSDKLDLQEFDWEDVNQVLTARPVQILLDDRRTVTGVVKITPTTLTVMNAEGNPEVVDRNELITIAPGGKSELNHWSGEVSAGLSLRSGNTEQTDLNVSFNLIRRDASTRVDLDYLGQLSSLDGAKSVDNHRVNLYFDWWLSKRLFLRAFSGEYFRDPFQNIDYRVTVGPSIGYDFVNTRRVDWSVTAGPAYQANQFVSVQPGQSEKTHNAALLVHSMFEWEINKRLDFSLEYSGQWTSREVGETTHHSVTKLEIDLTEVLELDLSFVWDRISQPKADASGVTPERDDFRLMMTLGVDF